MFKQTFKFVPLLLVLLSTSIQSHRTQEISTVIPQLDGIVENICPSLTVTDLKSELYEDREETRLLDDIDNASAYMESVADELAKDKVVTIVTARKQCEDTIVQNNDDNVKFDIKDARDFEPDETKETPVSRILILERRESPVNYKYERLPRLDASSKSIATLARLAKTENEKLALDVNQVPT